MMVNASRRLLHSCRILSSLVVLLGCAVGSGICWADSINAVNKASASTSDIQYHRGVSALAKSDVDGAEKAFREALRLQPTDTRSMLGLADVSLKRGQVRAAENHLHQASNKEPKNPNVVRGWGRFFYSQKRYSQAEGSFKQAVALAPKEALPQVDLAELYLVGLKQPGRAIGSYRAALALDPAHVGAHYGLGLALAATNQTDAALMELESALKSKPDFVQARLARGDLLLAKGETVKAIAEYQLAQKNHPTLALVQLKLGTAHEKGGQFSEAEKAYLTAISLDSRQAGALNNLAWLCAERRHRLDEAVFWAKKAVALEPTSPGFYDTLGWVHRARGESEKARTALEKACSLSPKLPEAYYHLGIVNQEMAQPKAAQSALQAALALKKEFAGAADARKRLELLTGSPK